LFGSLTTDLREVVASVERSSHALACVGGTGRPGIAGTKIVFV
jgi:hypothetical protein